MDWYNLRDLEIQKLKHTITQHNTARCSFGPPLDAINIDFQNQLHQTRVINLQMLLDDMITNFFSPMTHL
jgi:hypothetical protein